MTPRTAMPGTASAVLSAADNLSEDFLVVAGDVVCDPQNISALLSRFGAERPLAAALIQPLGAESPHDWLDYRVLVLGCVVQTATVHAARAESLSSCGSSGTPANPSDE